MGWYVDVGIHHHAYWYMADGVSKERFAVIYQRPVYPHLAVHQADITATKSLNGCLEASTYHTTSISISHFWHG